MKGTIGSRRPAEKCTRVRVGRIAHHTTPSTQRRCKVSLGSCVSCHTEQDCLACHSAVGGRRFNPHGPGFNADRMQKQNPQMCTACHGTAIPGA